MDIKPLLFLFGLLISALALLLLVPALADLYFVQPDWRGFLEAAAFTLFIGVLLLLLGERPALNFDLRQTFVLTTGIWVVVGIFGAIPFLLVGEGMRPVDALFESVSGITTTGSTVISTLDSTAPSLLLWRAMLQWLGGVGIIVTALTVLPILQVGGMQIFKVEGLEQSEKILPRVGEIAKAVGQLYTLYTLLAAVAFMVAGMSPFDAICHALTTVSTGGYSTHNASIAHFDSLSIELLALLFMLLGSLPFLFMLQLAQSDWRVVRSQSEVKAFLLILLSAILIITLWRMNNEGLGFWQALRPVAFNTTSLMTGTGFTSADYGQWGGLVLPLMLVLMLTGGCAGSTTCGAKVFRLQVMAGMVVNQLRTLSHPHGVFRSYYNGRPVTASVQQSVMVFLFLYLGGLLLLAVLLGATGLDFITALSSAATAIANVGPGMGDSVGPTGNFASLSDVAKLLMALGMILGRLEFLTLLVLLTPTFWRS